MLSLHSSLDTAPFFRSGAPEAPEAPAVKRDGHAGVMQQALARLHALARRAPTRTAAATDLPLKSLAADLLSRN